MNPTNPPLVNGINYSYSNITITLLGGIPLSVTEISYERKLESENHLGQGNEPSSFGYGAFSYPDGSITMKTDDVRQIAASAPNNSILSIPPFSIIVIYSGDGVNYTKDVINNVRFKNDPIATGSGKTGIDCKLMFAWAGLTH